MRIAPFYGIRGNGCARWLNRILVIVEIAFGVFLAVMQLKHPIVDSKWFMALLLGVWYLGVSVLNGVLHKLNSVFLAIFYGTTDPNEIVYKIKKREAKRKGDRKTLAKAGIRTPLNFELPD